MSLALDRGVLAIVGRNGMGKTTLCNAIVGLVPAKGAVRIAGQRALGLPPHRITRLGVGYVPQGRRVWPSLTVDEHLRLVASRRSGAWTVERIYETFPRLAERRGNGGSQLSGGEQQMLAISRALLLNPRLLVMDEPTEGLAPVIVDQVVDMLKALAREGDIGVLLVEQNLGVALDVADEISVMVNGRIARTLPSRELAADADLQQRLLGIRSEARGRGRRRGSAARPRPRREAAPVVYTVRRAGMELPADEGAAHACAPSRAGTRPTRATRRATACSKATRAMPRPRPRPREPRAHAAASRRGADRAAPPSARPTSRAPSTPRGASSSTSSRASSASACARSPSTSRPREPPRPRACRRARSRATIPQGERAVFTGDRGAAVAAMALAFERFIRTRRDLGGIVGAGGSGGTAMITQAMRALPIGVPKVMVSSVASGDVKPYVGPADICMLYSVTDVSGINRISEQVLANAAHAIAGMVAHRRAPQRRDARGDRPHHVRQHHAVRAGGHQGAGATSTTASSSTPPAPAASRWRSSPTRDCSRA